MPLYEYQCHKCGKVFEVIQKFSDVPLAIHEECGGEVERLLSAPAFHLKGSGWYATDYPKGGTKPEGKKPDSKADGSKDSPAGGEKSDSKTEASSGEKSGTTETKTEAKPAASTPKSD
jgi:putative FmdB family regulatory protein